MDRQRIRRWVETRALIRRGSGHYLIVRKHDEPNSPWEFPGARVPARGSAEQTLRRHCQAALGVTLEAVAPQPAFVHRYGMHTVEYHYSLCAVSRDEVAPLGYAELRWVLPNQLCEYRFDEPTGYVVDRLLGLTGR